MAGVPRQRCTLNAGGHAGTGQRNSQIGIRRKAATRADHLDRGMGCRLSQQRCTLMQRKRVGCATFRKALRQEPGAAKILYCERGTSLLDRECSGHNSASVSAPPFPLLSLD